MNKGRVWLCRVGMAVALCAWLGQVGAVEPYQEYRKRIEAAQNMTALKNDLFGESVSLYNGKTDFSVTDIDLPGNNGLPVRLSRRFSVELHLSGSATTFNANLEGAGGWDIDVPHISGTFSGGGSSWADTRCSGSMVPSVPGGFALTDIWQGNTIHIPGGGDRSMLGLEANTPRPNDGIGRKWTTSQRDAIDCIPMVAGLGGEGYRVTTTEGVRYSFNYAVSRLAGVMRKTLGLGGLAQASRTKIYVLATKVEDRFGNWVQYQYNGDGHPTRIWASDGREINLTYSGANLVSASANGRTWTYGYGSVSGSVGAQTRLTSVTLPDGSAWGYGYSNGLDPAVVAWDGNSTPDCAEQPPEAGWNFVLTATHPSGATGSFSFSNMRHYRSGVHMSACLERTRSADVGTSEYYYELATPNYFDVVSLTHKTISGPGIASPLQWTYSYGSAPQGLWGSRASAANYPCTSCATEKTVVVTNPDQTRVHYRYGFEYAFNEGKLLGSSTLDAAGTIISTRATNYMTAAQAASQPFAPRYGLIYNGDDPSSAQVLPETGSTVQQDGATYQSVNNSFDSLARPLSVTKASPWASRTDVTEYYDDTVRWILNQPSKLTNANTGLVVSQTSFDANAMPSQVWSFGKLQQTLTYNADGTVATVADGNNHVTTLASWKRGSPQSITYADSTAMSAVVDDNGWITSVTDENGYTSNYGYDAMGRIASIAYPAGDSVAWNTTTQAFAQVGGTEYGLGAGHWRQVVSTGNARKETYFDALWRPIVTREYDAANVGGTQRFQRFAYDEEGRQVFASYPGGTDALSAGNWTDYDALGRVTSVSQDSELGLLTTTTSYNTEAGYNTITTNPRGQQTRTWYQTFDSPGTDRPTVIAAPEGATTEIARDLFGKPTSIRRRNADSTLSVTRSYVYDGYQQLCKTIEPETGATATGYDGAGNVLWSASGLSLPNTASCDAQAAYDSGRRVSRTYDARNRLKTLAFPDGNGNQSWDYFGDGKPSQTITQNDQGASQTVNTYTYNKRRLLTAETSGQVGWFTWSLGYGYDANGSLASITYPSGLSVNYAPNALGQPTQAGSYATGVNYYPNGGMHQFTYGNGIVHTMAQNARQLPAQVTDGNVLNNSYSYDGNGNVAQILDNLRPERHRTMQYDGLDRLTQATSPSFGGDGVYRYTYDALDNIRSAKLTGIKQHNYFYDANNRLTNVQNDGGATTIGLSYDLQGNLNNKNGEVFGFDYGNRLRNVPGKTSYRYDAQGRRVVVFESAGSNIVSMYSQDGVLRRQDNSRQGKNYEYIHLNGSLVAKVTTVVAPVTPTLTAPSYSNNGSFTVSWNAVAYATSYELQEQVNGGAWAGAYTGTALSWATSGRGGATYGYRIRACQNAACSGWSATANTVVQLPPSTGTSISLAPRAANGNYSVSWGAIAGAATYKLEESTNGGGSWAVVQNTAATSAGFGGRPAGTYWYRVSGCNPAGCGPVSPAASTQSFYAPGAAPGISAPGQSLGGNYTVSWSALGDATTYRLEESANGAGWAGVLNGAQLSLNFYGKPTGNYAYRVQGCNDAGCGPYSGAVSVSVIQPPGAPGLSVPASNTTGSYTVSWNPVAMAVEYRLEQSANGGGWGLIQADGSTGRTLSGVAQGTYAYRVQACNAAGCSGYSNTGTIVVDPPPPTPTITGSIKYQWKQGTLTKIRCEVKWTASPGATSYNLMVPGSGLVQYTGPLTSINKEGSNYCAPSHVVRACNASGCSAYSSPPYTQAFEDLGNPTALAAPSTGLQAPAQGEGE